MDAPWSVHLTLARFFEEERDAWQSAGLTVLSSTERRRVETIFAPDTRTCHTVGRALIRLIGSGTGGGPAGEVRIAASNTGKPRLVDVPDLHVSVAHSDKAVLVASCRSAAVGVDIERPPPTTTEPRRLAQRCFALTEQVTAGDLGDDEFRDWFASVWTIKEAVGKALGVGMIPALAGAVVERRGQELALAAVWSGPDAADWTVHQLTAPGGTEKIAVALPAPGIALEPIEGLSLEAFSSACRAPGT